MLEEGEGGFDFRGVGVRGDAVGPEALVEAVEFSAFAIGFALDEGFRVQAAGEWPVRNGAEDTVAWAGEFPPNVGDNILGADAGIGWRRRRSRPQS